MRPRGFVLPLLAALSLPLAATPAAAYSKAADYLIAEQLTEACPDGNGHMSAAGVIERDLTGDGKKDLILSHDGITCGDVGRSQFCGAQACSVLIYVRRSALLQLEREELSVGVSVTDGALTPVVHLTAHGGASSTLQWSDGAFR
jgi:hypothetical protein